MTRAIDKGERRKEIAELISANGPMMATHVRGILFRRGVDLSEATVRAILRQMVVEKAIASAMVESRRSKRIVMYFVEGTPREAIAERVKAFDRSPNGFFAARIF